MKMAEDFSFLKKFISKDMFITSDNHFDHKNLVKFEPIREKLQLIEGKSIEMIMMERWNHTVPYDTSILHLGDFSWTDPINWGLSLTGNKLLLQGNHDNYTKTKYREAGFINFIKSQILFVDGNIEILTESCEKGASCIIADIENHRVLFSHIPIINDPIYDSKFKDQAHKLKELFDEYKCDINIHGHIHSNQTLAKFCRNVSVEVNDFKPIRITELLADVS